jgi:nicotinamidase/pyrazinamidase
MNYGAVILDPQYDLLDGGSINALNAGTALQNIVKLTADADLVVVTRDLHPDNHFSFKDEPLFQDGSWPVHCVEGTKGAKVFPAIRKRADYIISKGMSPVPPDAYSAFSAKKLRPLEDLIDILRRHPVDRLIIAGFLLEIGVKYTAFDANAIGHWTEVIVPLEACGTLLDAAGIAEAITPMRKAGIKIVDHFINE